MILVLVFFQRGKQNICERQILYRNITDQMVNSCNRCYFVDRLSSKQGDRLVRKVLIRTVFFTFWNVQQSTIKPIRRYTNKMRTIYWSLDAAMALFLLFVPLTTSIGFHYFNVIFL